MSDKNLREELENMRLTFNVSSVVQEAQPAKDIPEVAIGLLDGESIGRLEDLFRSWALEMFGSEWRQEMDKELGDTEANRFFWFSEIEKKIEDIAQLADADGAKAIAKEHLKRDYEKIGGGDEMKNLREEIETNYQSGDATRAQMLKEAGLTLEQYKRACVSVEEFINLFRSWALEIE